MSRLISSIALGMTGLALWSDALAYLDPGTGSAILQGILGALAALAITLKLYWHRLLRFFGLRKPPAAEMSRAHEQDAEGSGRESLSGDRPGS